MPGLLGTILQSWAPLTNDISGEPNPQIYTSTPITDVCCISCKQNGSSDKAVHKSTTKTNSMTQITGISLSVLRSYFAPFLTISRKIKLAKLEKGIKFLWQYLNVQNVTYRRTWDFLSWTWIELLQHRLVYGRFSEAEAAQTLHHSVAYEQRFQVSARTLLVFWVQTHASIRMLQSKLKYSVILSDCNAVIIKNYCNEVWGCKNAIARHTQNKIRLHLK